MMKNLLIIISVALLLCLAPMPYGYYTLVRFVSMVVFAVMAYDYWQKKKTSLAVTFGALALLFQPFAKIALGREMWNVVDVIVAIGLIVLVVADKKETK
jgi:hypothetical protein